MLKFVNHYITPPGGFRDKDSDTNMLFVESNLANLVKSETKHRMANNLSVDNLAAIIENRICSKMPSGICKDENGSGISLVRSHVAETVLNTSLAFNRELKKADGAVDQKTAEERAAICLTCPSNVNFSGGCSSCRGTRTIIRSIMGNRTLPHQEQLKACAISGLLAAVQVFAKPEVVNKAVSGRLKSKYPSHCWMVKGG